MFDIESRSLAAYASATDFYTRKCLKNKSWPPSIFTIPKQVTHKLGWQQFQYYSPQQIRLHHKHLVKREIPSLPQKKIVTFDNIFKPLIFSLSFQKALVEIRKSFDGISKFDS